MSRSVSTKDEEIEVKVRSIHVFIKFWSSFKGRMKSEKLPEIEMWKLEGGSKEVQKLLYMNPIENLKLKDYSFFRRYHGTMIKAKELVCVEN